MNRSGRRWARRPCPAAAIRPGGCGVEALLHHIHQSAIGHQVELYVRMRREEARHQPELQGLGIDFLLVEPGPTATGFGSALDQAEPLPAYDPTPAGALRRAFTSGGFALRGDAQRTVAAMIAAADERTPGLRRLALGSTAYASIHAALQLRFGQLQAQQALACSADIDG